MTLLANKGADVMFLVVFKHNIYIYGINIVKSHYNLLSAVCKTLSVDLMNVIQCIYTRRAFLFLCRFLLLLQLSGKYYTYLFLFTPHILLVTSLFINDGFTLNFS